MGRGYTLAPLTRADLESLHQPGREAVREALSDCISLLRGLFKWYSRELFGEYLIPEEDALGRLDVLLTELRDEEPWWLRMAQNVAQYWAFREIAEREGDRLWIRETALATADALLDQWSSLNHYPDFVHAVEALNKPRVQRT